VLAPSNFTNKSNNCEESKDLNHRYAPPGLLQDTGKYILDLKIDRYKHHSSFTLLSVMNTKCFIKLTPVTLQIGPLMLFL
jgi:hypothetical protein